MSTSFVRAVASIVVLCLMGLMAPVQAAIMPTASVAPAHTAERSAVEEFLSRNDVKEQLQAHGVNPQDALERVNALSDDEVKQLAAKIDQLPAGGSDILGIIFVVFIILLVTDILGLTKVFPFTRSVR